MSHSVSPRLTVCVLAAAAGASWARDTDETLALSANDRARPPHSDNRRLGPRTGTSMDRLQAIREFLRQPAGQRRQPLRVDDSPRFGETIAGCVMKIDTRQVTRDTRTDDQ